MLKQYQIQMEHKKQEQQLKNIWIKIENLNYDEINRFKELFRICFLLLVIKIKNLEILE